MKKSEFVSQAPIYYALAIASELANASTLSQRDIESRFSIEDDGEHVCLIDLHLVWVAAIDWLQTRGMIAEMKGSFGPSLYARGSAFSKQWADLCKATPPFNHFSLVDEKKPWLLAALRDVEDAYHELKLSSADFEKPDTEWEPVQIDPAEPKTQAAIEKLSDAVEQIRKDNGYAAQVPEERNYVVDGLTAAVEKMKSGTVSAGYLRDAWERLAIVSKRFAGASLELVITGAKQAIVEFVKSQGGELLRSLLHLFH